MESADVVLMKSDSYDIVATIELSRATLRKMHQNLWWAVGYNVIAFPLAAGVLYPFVESLAAVYAERFLSGMFAAAVTPVAMAPGLLSLQATGCYVPVGGRHEMQCVWRHELWMR